MSDAEERADPPKEEKKAWAQAGKSDTKVPPTRKKDEKG